MCDAVSLAVREVPTQYLGHSAVKARMMGRGGEEEVQFFYDRKPFPPLLPIILDGQFRIVRWGNRHKRSKMLPHAGRIEISEVEQGCWHNIDAQEVVILGNAALHRGVWFPILEGIRGLYVVDECNTPTVFMLMGKPTDYYHIMTKSKSMPLILGEVI